MQALQRAVDLLNGQAALAAAIGVKQQNVWNWLNRAGGIPPAEFCPAIERATEGKVRCEELRPDVAWDVVRGQTAPSDPNPGPTDPAQWPAVERRTPAEAPHDA